MQRKRKSTIPGQEGGLHFMLKNGDQCSKHLPCISLSGGHPVYDCPVGSSRQPRQTGKAPSVPQPPALHTQPPAPHPCAPGALLNKAPDPPPDVLSVFSHQPPSWSSSPGPAPTPIHLSPPLKRLFPSPFKILSTVPTFKIVVQVHRPTFQAVAGQPH